MSFDDLCALSPDDFVRSDANADGAVDITDPIVLLGYLFQGGAPPEPPFPSCSGQYDFESPWPTCRQPHCCP